ncbi:hypothetical protein U9M48_022269, partial [Paspalum notatum var. saurae]
MAGSSPMSQWQKSTGGRLERKPGREHDRLPPAAAPFAVVFASAGRQRDGDVLLDAARPRPASLVSSRRWTSPPAACALRNKWACGPNGKWGRPRDPIIQAVAAAFLAASNPVRFESGSCFRPRHGPHVVGGREGTTHRFSVLSLRPAVPSTLPWAIRRASRQGRNCTNAQCFSDYLHQWQPIHRSDEGDDRAIPGGLLTYTNEPSSSNSQASKPSPRETVVRPSIVYPSVSEDGHEHGLLVEHSRRSTAPDHQKAIKYLNTRDIARSSGTFFSSATWRGSAARAALLFNLVTGGKASNDGAQAQEPTRQGLTDELPAVDKENYSEEKLNLSFTQLLTGPI